MTSLPIIYLITNYGYLAIIAGSIFEGETILIIAGLAVQQGLLDLPIVFACSLIGTVLGDNLFFYLGRKHGNKLVSRFSFLSKVTSVSEKVSVSHGPFLSFAMRFMYGFRHLVPFSLGMSTIKTRTFIFFNFLGGVTWVLVIGLAGYFFGDVLEIYFGKLRHYEFRVIVFAIVIFVVARMIYKFIRAGVNNYLNK